MARAERLAADASAGACRRRAPAGETHLILAIADHFEPNSGGVSARDAQRRVDEWVDIYPRVLGGFRDADGRPPRHTFFYPIEAYAPDHLDALAEPLPAAASARSRSICTTTATPGENAPRGPSPRPSASSPIATGCSRRRRDDRGLVAYGFVHGNWALNNARPDGRWCGVNDEIRVLVETGCYADFTYPSAPGPTQPPTVNRLYYATSDPRHPRGHDRGVGVGEGQAPAGSLMLIPGPLTCSNGRRSRCKWGVDSPPRKTAASRASQPATVERLDLWLLARGSRCRPGPTGTSSSSTATAPPSATARP